MLRVHCSFPQLSLAAVTVAAVALLSCGGTRDSETLAGSSRVDSTTAPAPLASDTGTLDASADKELVCHKGSGKLVPPDAVPDHLAHGDTRGPCGICPCFTAAEIEALASSCTDTSTYRCTAGDPYFLTASCGQDAETYVTWSPDTEGRCLGLRDGSATLDEHQACVNELIATGHCP